MMITSVFKRREKKYLIDAAQRQAIETAARQFMSPDDYGRTLVTSVYLDTPDRSIIARSLEKPVYKEKLRIRAYGQEDGAALVFLCQHGLVAARLSTVT
jgi:SPX domain protein involved in polyphosphate accumulation